MADNAPISVVKTSLVLGAFAVLAAALLAFVNVMTAERIREQQLALERRALAEVFPAVYHDNDLLADAFILDPFAYDIRAFSLLDVLQLTTMRQGYIARKDGAFAGAILPVYAHDGYSGDILLLVGILADGSVSGVHVITHRETPGLGDKIDVTVDDWILGFDGKSLDNPPVPRWKVVKDGGEFDGMVGATVTPRAVVDAVMRALQFFQINRQQLEAL